MNIKDAVSFMCDLAKGEAEQFDVIASNTHSEGLSVFQGQVQNTEISDSVGLGVRVIKDGRPGYAHTERLTDEALRQTLKDALCHTQWTEKIDITLPQAVELPKGEPNYNPALESLGRTSALSLKRRLLQSLRKSRISRTSVAISKRIIPSSQTTRGFFMRLVQTALLRVPVQSQAGVASRSLATLSRMAATGTNSLLMKLQARLLNMQRNFLAPRKSKAARFR